jgi:hypothetical protein
MKLKYTLAAGLAILLLCACDGSSTSSSSDNSNPPPSNLSRSFYMGFTPWLYEASLDARDVTYDRLQAHGDIIKHHLQGGIPWQEALDQTVYHPNVEAEINDRLNLTPNSMEIFLSIDSLNTDRDGLSPYWAVSDNLPLPNEWANRSWNSDEVITAYINFAVDMIDRFQPLFFEYGTEVSELILNDPAGYADWVDFAQAVYNELKMRYPTLRLMTSVALKSPGSSEMQQIAANYNQVLVYTDIVGISTYPYVFYDHADRGDPANLPSNWLTQITGFSEGKPLAISETGWIAEDLDIPDFHYSESSNQTKQASFAQIMLETAEDLDMEFVIWWTVADFDTLWNNELSQDSLAKIWKDIGLYDENQDARLALQTWDNWLDRQRTN